MFYVNVFLIYKKFKDKVLRAQCAIYTLIKNTSSKSRMCITFGHYTRKSTEVLDSIKMAQHVL